MKKLAVMSLVLMLMFAALWMATAGSASASGSGAPPRAVATATPRPPTELRLPPSGGEADLSGALLVIGLGSLLVIGGLTLRMPRRPQA